MGRLPVVRVGARDTFLRFREADRRVPDQSFIVVRCVPQPWRVAEHAFVNELVTLAHPGFHGGRTTIDIAELRALDELGLLEPGWESWDATPTFRLIPRPEP
jgi:hypothetical protein